MTASTGGECAIGKLPVLAMGDVSRVAATPLIFTPLRGLLWLHWMAWIEQHSIDAIR